MKQTKILILFVLCTFQISAVAAQWQHYQGDIPNGAMVFGHNDAGQAKYMCEAYYNGQVYTGAIDAGAKQCQLKIGSDTVPVDAFSIYVDNHISNATSVSQKTGYGCVQGPHGEICGYNCASTGSQARCAPNAQQQCVADHYGHIACGYNCAASWNQAKCAPYPNTQCVSNDAGNVKCGNNCRLVLDKITCDPDDDIKYSG